MGRGAAGTPRNRRIGQPERPGADRRGPGGKVRPRRGNLTRQ
ncbi:hypothetical protein KPATCC21470_2751 [Kitasatospora purpeofusca]